MKFYKCKKCNEVMIINDDIIPSCCGEPMEELIPGSVEAAKEKHIPVVSYDEGYLVTVGEVEHPMTEEHYIEWIAYELENEVVKVFDLKPNQKPMAIFKTDQKVKAVYAYCNLHGLWKVEM